jgi:hypothetical protein
MPFHMACSIRNKKGASRRPDRPLTVQITPFGPDADTLRELSRAVLQQVRVQEHLRRTEHRLLSLDLVESETKRWRSAATPTTHLRASSSSPGRRMSLEPRPCLRALWRTAAFPSGVFGPVLLRALRRLARACLSLVICLASPWFLCRWSQRNCSRGRAGVHRQYGVASERALTRCGIDRSVRGGDSRIVLALCCMLTVMNGAHC